VVVSGNVRRSAELLMGSIDDPEFIQLKNPEVFPERQEWAFMSNNSVEVTADTDLSPIIEGIKLNGEPGVIWMDITRNYGRLIDPPDYKDWRAAGFNPCAEQSLESYELCTLDEAFLNRHESKDDLLRSLKFAYLYGKTVTLLPTHWPETNAVMQRNRRIGTSVSGVADFADAHGLLTLRDWLNDGYAEVRKWDHIYSEWLAIRESIRVTTVKPSGTVSLLAGASPGVHWAPGGRDYLRGIVFGKDDPIAGMLGQAGYTVETSAYTPDTSVFIQFPIHTDAHRDERQVSLYEKANLAVVAQRYWSDNSVSVTLSFDAKEEADAVERVLTMHAGQLKTVSFLPMGNDTYAQMPYQRVEPSVIEEAKMRLFKVDFSPIYDGDTQALEALGEAYCSTDACLIPNQ
jgi:adenosylcobalamin-dependent ribonucleoside-triphosphate reductase